MYTQGIRMAFGAQERHCPFQEEWHQLWDTKSSWWSLQNHSCHLCSFNAAWGEVRPQHLQARSQAWKSKVYPHQWELRQKSLLGEVKQDRFKPAPAVQRHIQHLALIWNNLNRGTQLLPSKSHFLQSSRLPNSSADPGARESLSPLPTLSSSTSDHSWGRDAGSHTLKTLPLKHIRLSLIPFPGFGS